MPSFHQAVTKKIDRVSKMLGVSDYSFHIIITKSKKPKNKYDVYGSVIIDEETREVVVNINEGMLKKRPDQINNTIVHELLHVRFSELCSLINVILSLYVKDMKAKKAYTRQIEQLEHKIIVALSGALTKRK